MQNFKNLPKKYKVVLMNDHKTPNKFLKQMLQNIFHKSAAESEKIIAKINLEGTGIVGTYTYEIAETYVNKVLKQAKKSQHPLQAELKVLYS